MTTSATRLTVAIVASYPSINPKIFFMDKELGDILPREKSKKNEHMIELVLTTLRRMGSKDEQSFCRLSTFRASTITLQDKLSVTWMQT